MFISPIQNKDNKAPVVTQGFGYTGHAKRGAYGGNPHRGIDLRTRGAINLYAPTQGVCKYIESKYGFGKHILIRDYGLRTNPKSLGWEIVLAHLSESYVKTGNEVRAGDLIGKTGNTGNSTAHHLHFAIRPLIKNVDKDIWEWEISKYDNEFKGYIDPAKLTIDWQGTYDKEYLNYLHGSVLKNILDRKNA